MTVMLMSYILPDAINLDSQSSMARIDQQSPVQHYSRDLLAFLFCILTLVAWLTGSKSGRGPMLLNRPQTEEWKGWMQVQRLMMPCSQ